MKYSVSSSERIYCSASKLPNDAYTNLIALCKYIRKIFQKYTFKNANLNVKKIVFDFLQEESGEYIFLQIKHVEADKHNININEIIKSIRMKKGLDIEEKQCDGPFCQPKNFGFVKLFEMALIKMKLLDINWIKTGFNEETKDYLNMFLNDYKKCIMKNENMQTTILSPFFTFFNDNVINNSEVYLDSNFEGKFLNRTCDLCHKILQIYNNKKKLEKYSNNAVNYKVSKMN